MFWFKITWYTCRNMIKATINMVDYSSQDSSYRQDEKHGGRHSSDLENTLRSLNVEIRSFKVDNGRIIQEKEKQVKFNVVILQILSYCRDRDHLGSSMGRRILLMEHITLGLMVDIGLKRMTQLDMVGSQIHWIGEVMDMSFILVLVLTGTMIFMVIILTSGVTGDIYQMSSRNPRQLPLMGI